METTSLHPCLSQVWASHAANLLHIDRYHFFAASARLWHPGASSPLEAGKDEEPETGQLSVYLRVLRQIHERFFDDVAAAGVPVEQRDVRLCVRDVRCVGRTAMSVSGSTEDAESR